MAVEGQLFFGGFVFRRDSLKTPYFSQQVLNLVKMMIFVSTALV